MQSALWGNSTLRPLVKCFFSVAPKGAWKGMKKREENSKKKSEWVSEEVVVPCPAGMQGYASMVS